MILLAFIFELLVSLVLLLAFGHSQALIMGLVLIFLVFNLVIFRWSHAIILNRLNAVLSDDAPEYEFLKNISFKLKSKKPTLYTLTDFPLDILIVYASRGRLILGVGRDILNELNQSEIEKLLEQYLTDRKQVNRYYQWLVIKIQLIHLSINLLKEIKFLRTISFAFNTIMLGKLNSSIISNLKRDKLINVQDILLKLNRKKGMEQKNLNMIAAAPYIALSMTETHEDELVAFLT
ncbi:MAG: hypothetical protein Fur0010_07470 [Bdellovibrio sp.]